MSKLVSNAVNEAFEGLDATSGQHSAAFDDRRRTVPWMVRTVTVSTARSCSIRRAFRLRSGAIFGFWLNVAR